MKKLLGLSIFSFIMLIQIVFSIDITLVDYYGIDNDLNQYQFNTSSLDYIEDAVIKYQISSANGIDSWYLNYTMDGKDSCALGNIQDNKCYNYYNNNLSQVWVHFINDTITDTFDPTSTLLEGNIVPELVQVNASLWNLTLTISEHFQNVLKHYDSGFNNSDILWQTGKKITTDNYVETLIIHPETNNPFTTLPDNFKVEIEVNYTKGALIPSQPLDIYTCFNYTSGDPELISSCSLLCSKSPNEFQGDGAMVRCTGVGGFLSNLGGIPSNIILTTNEINPAKYYYIKSYKITTLEYDSVIRYTTDGGVTYTNNTDGYETDVNVNWFNNGANSTKFMLDLFVNSTTESATLLSSINWSINPSTNYSPVISINQPTDLAIIDYQEPVNLTWTVVDYNQDNLNITIFINNQVYITNLNQSNTSYYIGVLSGGVYDIRMLASKIINPNYFDSNIHTIYVSGSSSGVGGGGPSTSEIVETNDSIIEEFNINVSIQKDTFNKVVLHITLLIIIAILLLVLGKYYYRDKRFTIRMNRYNKFAISVVSLIFIYYLIILIII